MTLRTTTRIGLALSFSALLSGVGLSSADASTSQCPPDWFCVWTNNDYTGAFGRFRLGDRDLAIDFPSLNNNIESVWNRTIYPVSIYQNAGYSGPCSAIGTGVLRPLTGTARNTVSSIRVSDRCSG
ncbi:MAG: peptidase inhibitor family I36 protein [Kineosporiaceae bacterium]|jgi:hypothetical protein